MSPARTPTARLVPRPPGAVRERPDRKATGILVRATPRAGAHLPPLQPGDDVPVPRRVVPRSAASRLPALDADQAQRWRWEATVAVLSDLGVLPVDADPDAPSTRAIVGEAGPARGRPAPESEPFLAAVSAGEAKTRLKAAAQRTSSEAGAEQAANQVVNRLALSLSLHDEVPVLYKSLGVAQPTWRTREIRGLGLDPTSEVDKAWYRDATSAELAARAQVAGVEHVTDAAEQLPEAVHTLITTQARWAGARRVRDALVRELYPDQCNQPQLQTLSGLTQAQVWQIINPDFRQR